MDPNTTMETIGEGAKALTKFQEILLKLFGPNFTKRQADADAYADERKLQTIRENPDMEIVYANGQMNARSRTPEALASRAEQRQLAETIRQEENLESILEKTEEQISIAEDISETAVNEDWLTRFFGIAKDVSTDEMQFIWGKILAGEIEKPGSFSLRTLETIRNISPDEAKLFEKILPFVVSSGAAQFIPADLISFSEFGITYGHIIQLDECGMVYSNGATSLNIKAGPNEKDQYMLHSGNEVLLASNPTNVELQNDLRVYPLTRSAIELMSILDSSTNHDAFVRLSEKMHREHFSNATMSIYEVIYSEDGQKHYNSDRPLHTFCQTIIHQSGQR